MTFGVEVRRMTSDANQKMATDFGLHNVALIAEAANAVGIPFYAACALMEKESNGRNIYGGDLGGTLSRYPYEVDEHNFKVFEWLVMTKGRRSNGVGPSQITYRGFFPAMAKKGLKPWLPYDNMRFGMDLFYGYYKATGSWAAAGKKYNGAASYGRDMERKVAAWKKRLAA